MKNRLLTILILISSVLILPMISMPFSHAALVAHLPLDEGLGQEVKDATGNGYHGLFKGNPDWVDGVYGKALQFDGDDYVEVEKASDIKPESITMSTWVYFDDVTSRRDFLSRDDDFALSLGGNPQDGKLWAVITTGGDWLDVSGKTLIERGKWYHVALTFDSKTKILTLYLNGELDGEGNAPAGMEHRQGGPLTIGTYQTRYLIGKLDDIKIWDESLSSDGIKEAMKPAAVKSSGKLAITWGEVKLP